MAGGDMGSLWASLYISDKTEGGINSALLNLKKFDGAMSKVYEELLKKQGELKKALGAAKVDPQVVSKLKGDVKHLELGIKNALAYKEMLASVGKELDGIRTLKKLNVGVDKSKLVEAQRLIKDFQRDLERTTNSGLGGLGENTWMANFKKNWGIVQRRVRELTDSFKKENALTDSATWEARITRSIERVKQRMFDLKSKMSEGYRLGISTTPLLSAYNRLNAVLRRGTATDKNGNLIATQSESAFLKLLSDIGVASAKAATDVKRYTDSKNKAAAASRRAAQAEAEQAAAVRQLVTAFNSASRAASGTSRVLSDMKSLFLQGGIVFGAQQFFNQVVRTGGEIEQQHIALQSILGDVSKANELFDQTKRLALESPFTFGELNRDVKQLAAFGVEADDIYDTTKRLADISAGLGVSFERLGLAYGQVKARSWLDGKELRQFAYAGLPMLQKLADLYNQTRSDKTYTTRDVREMITKREVSFEDVDAVIKRLTDEGGQFYNLQYVLSETLLGQYNKLKDAWDIMLGQMASGNSLVGSFFKTGIQLATAFVQAVDKIGPVLAAAFSGVAFSRLWGAARGGVGSAILAAKDSLAKRYQVEALAGKKLSDAQQRILATKGRITAEDLKTLAASKSITQSEIRRLYVTNQITTEQYRQLAAMNGAARATWTWAERLQFLKMRVREIFSARYVGNFFGRVGAGFKMLGSGIKSLGVGLYNFMGGWVGMGITAISVIATRAAQARRELRDAAERMREEQAARSRSADIFLTDNPASSARAAKDEKERLAALENYLEKLKEVAPHNAAAYSMGAAEKKSHEERIDYLEKELRLVRAASGWVADNADRLAPLKKQFEGTAKSLQKMSNARASLESAVYNMTAGGIDANIRKLSRSKDTKEFAEQLAEARKAGSTIRQMQEMLVSAARQDASIYNSMYRPGSTGNYHSSSAAVFRSISGLAQLLRYYFPDVESNPLTAEKYRQAREAITSQLQMSPSEKTVLNVELDLELGVKNSDLHIQLASEMRDAISRTMPEAALMIQNDKELPEAAKKKVREMMSAAVQRLITQYPQLSGQLQKLLDESNFKAIIHLAFASDEPGEMERRFYGNLPSALSPERKNELYNAAKDWLKEGSMAEVRDAADKAAKSAKENLDAEKDAFKHGAATAEDVAKARKRFDDIMEAARYGLGHTAKTSSGAKKDTALEETRDRVALYGKFFSEYKKLSEYMGGSAALASLRDSGDFSAVFGWGISDVTNYAGALDTLTASLAGTTEARRKFLNSTEGSKATKRREDMVDMVKAYIADVKQEMKLFDTRYQLYRKIVEKTGDSNLANMVAFRRPSGDDYSIREPLELIRQKVADAAGTDTEGAARILGMSREQIEQAYGKDSVVGQLWEQAQERQAEQLKEASSLYEDIITKHQTIADKIEAENAKYAEQLRLLQSLGLPQGEYEKRRSSIDETHSMTLGDLQFEQFKQDSGWEQVFRDLDRVSNQTLRRLLSGLRGLLSTNNMSEEGVRAVVGAMDKIAEHLETTSPFASIAGGFRQLSIISGAGRNNGNYVFSREQASMLGLKPSKNGEYSEADVRGVMQGVFKGMSNSVSGVEEQFKALRDVLAPVTELLSSLGMGEMAEGMGIAGKAFGSASSTAGAFNTLSQSAGNAGMGGLSKALGNAGPWAAVAATGLSVVSSLFSMKSAATKAYEKQAKYLAEISKTTSEISDSVSGNISQTRGTSATEAYTTAVKAQKLEAEEVRKTLFKWAKAGGNGLFGTGKSNARKLNKKLGTSVFDWMLSNGWNGTFATGGKYSASRWDEITKSNMYMLMNLSGKDLEKFRNANPEAWSKIDSKAREYLETIISIEGEEGKLTELTESLAEARTDMTLESIQSEYKDLLNQLDSDNEDFADKFEEHLRNAILNGMIANLYADEIQDMIDAASAAAGTEAGNLYISKSGAVKAHTGGDDSSDVASEFTKEEYEAQKAVNDALSQRMTDMRDYLRSVYGWTDEGSSMSSSVKGITENTADLLAAYLNAIRADVSVIRQLDGIYWPKLDVTTVAQLQELDAIADNTRRNVDAVVRMESALGEVRDILAASRNSTRPLSVKVS